MRGTRRTLVITTLALSLGLMSTEAKAFDVVYTKDSPVRWFQNEIAFKINQEVIENTDNQFGPSPASAIQESFASWNGVNGTDLNFTYGGSTENKTAGKDSENIVFMEDSNWMYGQGVIAITITTFKTDSGRVVDADIALNDVDYDWTTVNPADDDSLNGKVDIQNIVTHEIGHFIGLDHSSEEPFEEIASYRNAAMFFSSYPGDIAHRTLNDDDRAAKRFLYSANSVSAPIIDEFSPTLTSNVENRVEIEILGSNFMPQTLVRFHNGAEDVTVVAKITENEADRLVAVASFLGQPTGDWDVVVANAHDALDRIDGALRVNGLQATVAKATNSSGGCGAVDAPTQSSASLLLAIAALITMMGCRRQRVAVRIKRRP